MCEEEDSLPKTMFLFCFCLFFISTVSPPVSLTTGRWSPAPVISEEDHVLMPGPGLITGPWQKPSDYIRHTGPQGGEALVSYILQQQGLCSRQFPSEIDFGDVASNY